MATFTGTNNADTANATTGTLIGFTGGTVAELQDGIGDTIVGLGGPDTIIAGSGNDTLIGGADADTLNGGGGSDTASYATAGAAITARLDLAFGLDVGGVFDTYTSIENVTGSDFADVIVGKGGEANTLSGGQGDDTFIGEGIDTVNGGSGNDVFFGGQGSALNINLATASLETVWGSFVGDVMDGSTATANLTMVGQGLTGGANADTMTGGSGDDFIYFRAGDVINGGTGNDWAVATLSAAGVSLNMTATGFENAWGSTSDDLITAAGSATAAVIVGDVGDDTLTGGNAGDFLYGFGDNDTLTGGGGNDHLIGGTGTDTFAFGAGWGIDIVWDWVNGSEQFDLAGSGVTQFSQLTLTTVGANAVASFAGNQIWVINGAGQIDATDFLFDPSVWFIDNTAPGSTNVGTQANPFTSIAAFNAAQGTLNGPDAGAFVYLRDGTYTEADGINLANGQTLVGQGQNLVVNGVIIETGSAGQTPNIVVNGGANDGIDLAQNNTISGLNVSTTTGTGKGIDDNGNVGTLNISDISVSTASGTGIELIGGGTVTVTGPGNTISSGTGTALNITNTTIGAADVTFQSISAGTGAGSAGVGISLDSTGSLGGLHITGNGAAGTGGTIQHKTGADGSTTAGIGIYLNNTSDVQLNWMQLNDLSNFGIRGSNVIDFSFDNSVISGTNGTAAGAFDEAAISFNNLLGSASISDSNIGNGFEYILKILNSSGTLNRLTIDNTDFGTNNTSLGGDAVQIVASNTATVNVTVTNSSFTNAREDLFNALATQTADMDVVFRDNTLSNNHSNKVSAASNILVFSTSTGDVTYDISHNSSTTGATGSAIAVAKGIPDLGSGGTMTGTVNANTIGVAGVVGSGSEFTGIFASALGSGTHTTAITNNTIRHYNEEGIFLKANDSLTGGNSVLNATVTGNITTEPDSLAFAGLWVVAGSSSGTENNVVNVVVGNASTAVVAGSPTGSLQNDFTNGDPANGTDVFLQEFGSNSVINLSRAGSAAGTAAGVIQDDNVGTPAVVASGTVSLVNTLPPTPPPVAPLLAADDGVQAALDGAPGEHGDFHLSQAELDSVVQAAIGRWADAGASAAQLELLQNLDFAVADLAGQELGSAGSGQIVLDVDAAGHGWFIDPTPDDDLEFPNAASGTGLLTDPSLTPAGDIDLLTVLMHEMGHGLGLDDLTAADARDVLMFDHLVTGERRLPGAVDLQPTPASHDWLLGG